MRKILLLTIVMSFYSLSAICQKTYKSEIGLTMIVFISNSSVSVSIPDYHNFKGIFYYDSSFMDASFYKSSNGQMMCIKNNQLTFPINNQSVLFTESSNNQGASSRPSPTVYQTRDGSMALVIAKKMYQKQNTKGFGPSSYMVSYYEASIEKLRFKDAFYYQESSGGRSVYASKSGNMLVEIDLPNNNLVQINLYFKETNSVMNFFGRSEKRTSNTPSNGKIILPGGSRTQRVEACYTCDGNKRCPICKGIGYTRFGGQKNDCSACGGSGTCYTCFGTGVK